MGKLDNKVAIVTGSTSGIGEAIAREYVHEGATVVITGRNIEKGEAITEDIKATGGSAIFVACDTSIESDIINLVDITIQKYGRLDILINNAGLFFTKPLEETSSLEWDNMFDINVRGYMLVSKYALPHLIKSGNGAIINNSSVAGMLSYASGQSYAYSASKAAVIQLSRVMAKNYAKDHIRVNVICPGIIKTPIFGGRDISHAVAKIPIGRIGLAEDVAKAATFLASNDADYITGIVLPIDGGLSI